MEYLKRKLQVQRAKRRSRSHPAHIKQNVTLERNTAVCHGRIGTLIFILSYLRTRDPERILPYVDRGTFIF